MRTLESLIELQGTQENLWEPVGTRYLIEGLVEEEIEQKALRGGKFGK